MPTYVYKFVKTGETIEVQQAFTDETLTTLKHPQTGRRMAVKKVFQPVGVTFKGSGFFKNDNRGAKSGDSSGSESSESAKSSEKGSDTGSGGDSSSAGSKSESSKSESSKSESSSTSSSSSEPKKKATSGSGSAKSD